MTDSEKKDLNRYEKEYETIVQPLLQNEINDSFIPPQLKQTHQKISLRDLL